MRKSRSRNTLVIEILGIFAELVDPQAYHYNDRTVKELSCEVDGNTVVALLKFWPMGLVQHLRKLVKYYEIVIFTILPRGIVTKFFDEVPGLHEIISHSICYEELTMLESNNFVYKDLSLLDFNRHSNFVKNEDGEIDTDPSEIIVIDCKAPEEFADLQCVTYIQSDRYEGQFQYQNIQ